MDKVNKNNDPVSTSPVKKPDAIEITLPENLSSYLTPLVIIFGTVLIAIAIFVTGNNITNAIKNVKVSGTTAAADTTGTTPAAVVVTDAMISGLWDKTNVLKFGSKDAKVHFVEFSDPSCPYCHIAGGHNPELAKQLPDNDKDGIPDFQYVSDGGKYLPPVPEMEKLVNEGKASFMYIFTVGHGAGEMAAQALYCANDSGNFWAVHNKLMTNDGYTFMNNGKGNTDTTEMAKFLASETDQSKMQSCLDSKKYAQTLQDDIATATEFGVSGTPGFFVNTTSFAGAYGFTDMQSAVDAALNN
jgi:protein-disulfide isomerase